MSLREERKGMKKLFGGLLEGVGGELGQPDLVKKVTAGIARLARHADRGLPVLPREVEVTSRWARAACRSCSASSRTRPSTGRWRLSC